MRKLFLFLVSVVCYLTSFSQQQGTFKDTRDSKVYKTIKIGNQIWFAENFAYQPTTGKYWKQDNDSSNLIYGYFYDWETAKKICPVGWHLPTIEDWEQLINTVGNPTSAGKLKSKEYWESPNFGATNESGFNAVPAGCINLYNVLFCVKGQYSNMWANKEYGSQFAYYIELNHKTAAASQQACDKKFGLTVRYIKD